MTTDGTDQKIRDFLESDSIALVGASNDPAKYGNIILKNLRKKGYAVLPVNPKEQEIEGIPCYPSLKSLPAHVKTAVLVVPPQGTERVVQDARESGVHQIWMQPGAESKTAIEFCKEHGISVIFNACIMTVAGYRQV